MNFTIVTPTTPARGADQKILFSSTITYEFPTGSDIKLESGIRWYTTEGWAMYCRSYKDGRLHKASRRPVRPGTKVSGVLSVVNDPQTGQSDLACFAIAAGYPQASVKEGPFPHVTFDFGELLFNNTNYNTGGDCRQLVDAREIRFSDIKISTRSAISTIDWQTDHDSSCQRQVVVLDNSSSHGVLAIRQNPAQ
ncbi:hypothetical protein [Vibrio ouci]|uniref:Uncharacterized protein n=1 Tax=Vibrio ouci TaxID=2499078 RepID=A0A4Y8W9E8_9VIBR|nr:hypothetical protein [Vibrio ouci]TFH89572.1 hypothetical protein ELS82_21550 [Vibrio ouci]